MGGGKETKGRGGKGEREGERVNLINKPILKSIGPKLAILSPKKKPPKITKMAISQNPILPKCHSPKSLLHLHFSMNLPETCRIDVNMDFTNTNCSRFLAAPIPPSPFSLPFPPLLALSLPYPSAFSSPPSN